MNTEIKEAKRKGRQKGQTLERSFIIDPKLEPYRIRISEGSYDVIKKDSIMAEGYYTNLTNALKKIALLKTNDSQKEFTLAQYIDSFNNKIDELKNIISV